MLSVQQQIVPFVPEPLTECLEAEFKMTSADRSSPQNRKSQRTIYLDCNATTLTHPVALRAAREAMELCYGNPSSTHITGLHAKSFLESARDAATVAVGARSNEEIIFNSGATEGIQTTIFSVLNHLAQENRARGSLQRFRILFGSTEHKAVPTALSHWAEILGAPVIIEAIPVDSKGIFDFKFIESRLQETALLCTMAVNNETGVIQPLQPLADLLGTQEGSGCLWFIDGVQALGKFPLQLNKLGAHYACFSGHKINAPKGIGFLYVRSGAPYTPLIVGGGQERGMRSGTENLPGAAAFGRILRELNEASSNVFLSHSDLLNCQQKLIQTLSSCFPTLAWNVDLDHCVPTTLNFSVEGVSSRELMNAFDAAGVRVSGGSACSSGKASESHVLAAMHLHKWRAQNAIRLSFGPGNSLEDIDEACRAIQAAGEALQASCMIPNLPARAEQLSQLMQVTGPGISELRSSQGTRAWLICQEENNSSKNFLVADCSRALCELQNKLACRGLTSTQILVLDEKHESQALPEGWHQFETGSGTSLLLKNTSGSNGAPTLFCPTRNCLVETLNDAKANQLLSGQNVLICLADEATPLSAYDVIAWSDSAHQGSTTRLANVSSEQPSGECPQPLDVGKIECSREELAAQLKHKRFMVLDVREPFESATSHLDEILIELLGAKASKKLAQERKSHLDFHVLPLSRLPQFLLDCLEQKSPEHILCVCRSGQRSLQAAQLLRRVVHCQALSLKGGLAALLAPAVSLSPRQASSPPHAK